MNIKQSISSEFWKQYGNINKFSREAGVDRGTVRSFLYDNEYNPTLATLEKFCETLGLELVVRKAGYEQN